MSLLGMPWVVVNLGCEMVYILEQRLKVQGIAPDKAVKVLQDIVRTMFDQCFMEEKLFVPQEMYSLTSTRKIFDKLAHSSIMRLSESRYVTAVAAAAAMNLLRWSAGWSVKTRYCTVWTSCLT